MRAFARALLLALVVSSAVAGAAEGQSWRTTDVARQARDSAPLGVRVMYGEGRVGLRAASVELLYNMHMRYDADRVEAVHTFDASGRMLRLGARTTGVTRRRAVEPGKAGELRVELARAVPLDLTLEFGAAEADLDLSGLSLTRLKLESGASEARVRFDVLNPVRMSSLDIESGAASIRIDRLANANARDIRVRSGVGELEIDFGGRWTQDIDLTVDIAMGGVVLHVPSDVGIHVEISKVFASFAHEGLTKRGNAWESENFSGAPHKLRIRAQTLFGSFEIDRTGR